MKPLFEVSVAMCTYNGERYLRGQLDSIVHQTALPAEVVICDDGSADSTLDIVADFTKTAPFDVHLVRNRTNLGSTKNFEQAMGLCRGELIALCDQDDLWNESKLAALAALFVDNSIGGAFSDGELIDSDSAKSGRTLFGAFGFTPALRAEWCVQGAAPILLRQPIVTGATLMFRSRLRSRLLPISPKWIHDAWIAWIIASTSTLEFLETLLIRYRTHDSQQAGVPAPTFGSRLAGSLQENAHTYLCMAQQFEDLRDRLASCPDHVSPGILSMIEDKIRFSHFRSTLASNRLARLPQVLSHLPVYRRCARGFREALKDVIR
jgi:glycosyltransferase involved in cell wall biosynthesis